MNAIAWQVKALRQLRKVPPQSATEIRAAVSTELTDMTTARNVKALMNHEYSYRLVSVRESPYLDGSGTSW